MKREIDLAGEEGENFPLQSQMYYCNQRQRKHFYDWIRTYNAKSGEYEQIAIGETE